MHDGDVLAAIAARIDQVKVAIGLRGVSYPALNTVPGSPWAMVQKSVAIPSRFTKERAGLEVVYLSVDVVLLVTSDHKRPGDAARLDGLAARITDLFDANANGGNVNNAFRGLLDEPVDQIWNDAPTRRLAADWAEGGYCHAEILTMNAKFKRRTSLP